MIIKKYVLTVAVMDGEASRVTDKVIEEACNHGMDLEVGVSQAFVTPLPANMRYIDYPDPSYVMGEDPGINEKQYEKWLERAEKECTK